MHICRCIAIYALTLARVPWAVSGSDIARASNHRFGETDDSPEPLRNDDDNVDFARGRNLQQRGYEEPPWLELMLDVYEGVNPKRCFKRQSPPENGTSCAKTPKTCFFGLQDCSSLGSVPEYPDVECRCRGGSRTTAGTWTCVAMICPGGGPACPEYKREESFPLILKPNTTTADLVSSNSTPPVNDTAIKQEPVLPTIVLSEIIEERDPCAQIPEDQSILRDEAQLDASSLLDQSTSIRSQPPQREESVIAASVQGGQDQASQSDESVRRTLQSPYIATIWKVRRCRIRLFCFTTFLTRPEFGHWEVAGVSRQNQKDTYIGILREPPTHLTKRLVLTIAGQQSWLPSTVGSGTGDTVSGSFHGWHSGWHRNIGSENHPIGVNSYAHEFFHRFTDGETYIATTWSTAFDYLALINEKQRIENAYYNWLLSKANAGNLEEVILAGFSRGGCLALRLAARFNQNFPGVRVAILGADPVCHVGSGEFGASGVQIMNPWNIFQPSAGYWVGATTEMRTQFKNEGCNLYVKNLVSGHRNFVLNPIRGLSQRTATTTRYEMGGWYHQDWIRWPHWAADNWATTFYSADEFYDDASDWFQSCFCPNPCPYGGVFDSVHCYYGSPPMGTNAFLWDGNYYYTPIGVSGCPRTDSSWDTVNCYVADAPDHLNPFVYDNKWYYDATWDHKCCNATWTNYLDRDNPGGVGDFEQLVAHTPVPCGGDTPVHAQCTADNGLDAWETGDAITYSASSGCVCRNEPGNTCDFDYSVRFLCPPPPYWTGWYNRDGPGNIGDYELTADQTPPPCDGEQPIYVLCETLGGINSFDTGEVTTCNVAVGFYCKNSDQSPGTSCSDYRIRYLCPPCKNWSGTYAELKFPDGTVIADVVGDPGTPIPGVVIELLDADGAVVRVIEDNVTDSSDGESELPPGIVIRLTDEDGNVIATTTTEENGAYSFVRDDVDVGQDTDNQISVSITTTSGDQPVVFEDSVAN